MRPVPQIVVLLAALAVGGCLPDLGGWRVPAPEVDSGPARDGGNRDGGNRDGGGIDASVLPVDDCSAPIRLGAGYAEGFESGTAGWGIATENERLPSWQWGTPAGEVIRGAAEGSHAFMTGLDTDYGNNEESVLVSPCFDASEAANDLLLTFSRAYESEMCCDRASVEYSVDGGDTWQPATGEARLGWYAAGTGWGGQSDWGPAATLLAGTAGQARVQFRIRWHSDASVSGDGFAIDDVALRASTTDLALELAEAERCGYVVATVTNAGGAPVTGFEIRTTVDGANDLTPYDRRIAYLETQTLELGGPLARVTSASVFTTGDVVSANDAASFTHRSVPLGGGYFSDFEADDGGLVVGGQNPSWAWGDPEGALIGTAASGTRAWVTNLTGDYNNSEVSWIQTACFDMSSGSRDPQVSLMQAFRTEDCCDGARVEVSVDGGAFRAVGSTSSGGSNWYNNASYGWTGSSGAGAWRDAQHVLTGTMGGRAVRVRVVFRSDGSQTYEGFGIDDLQIIP